MPPSDEGEVRVTGEMEVGTRLDLVDRQTLVMEQIVRPAVPELESYVATAGASGWNASAQQGELRMSLVSASKRTRSNTEIAADLRKRLEGNVAGMTVRTRAPQGQFLLDRVLGGNEGMTVEIRGFDLATLQALADTVVEAVADVQGLQDLKSSLEAGTPQREIRVDRERVADVGLSVRDVTEALETAVAGSRAGEFRTGGNSYRILVQIADAEKRSLDEILDLTLTTPSGMQVALRNVVTTAAGRGPVVIERKDQERIAKVTGEVVGRDMGSVARDVQARLANIPRPAGESTIRRSSPRPRRSPRGRRISQGLR
jgi:HAE1 family hydrophobic/amphiphilic exporter-1